MNEDTVNVSIDRTNRDCIRRLAATAEVCLYLWAPEFQAMCMDDAAILALMFC